MVDFAKKQTFEEIDRGLTGTLHGLPLTRGRPVASDPTQEILIIRNELLEGLTDQTRKRAALALELEELEGEAARYELKDRVEQSKQVLEERRKMERGAENGALTQALIGQIQEQNKTIEDLRQSLGRLEQARQQEVFEGVLGELRREIGSLKQEISSTVRNGKAPEGDFLENVEKVIALRERLEGLFPQQVPAKQDVDIQTLLLLQENQRKLQEMQHQHRLDEKRFEREDNWHDKELDATRRRNAQLGGFLDRLGPQLEQVLAQRVDMELAGAPPGAQPHAVSPRGPQPGVETVPCPACGASCLVYEGQGLSQNVLVCPTCGTPSSLEYAGPPEETPAPGVPASEAPAP